MGIVDKGQKRNYNRSDQFSTRWQIMKQILKLFLGVCLILLSGFILLYNLFLIPTSFDFALGILDLFIFFCGLFLTLFNLAKLPRS